MNYILAMHKILTVWTKFLHTFILWMLLSKSDFLNPMDDSDSYRSIQTDPGYSSRERLINQVASNNSTISSNHRMPNVFVELLPGQPSFCQVSRCSPGDKIGQRFGSGLTSRRRESLIPKGAPFPVNIIATLGSASSQRLPQFTTEYGIYTGMPDPTPRPPPPLTDFEVSINETFGTFMYMQISWSLAFNITKVELRFTNVGGIIHQLEMPMEFLYLEAENIFPPESGRFGFIYQLGSLAKSKRYYLQAWGYSEELSQPLYDKQSFLTDDQDNHDRIYDLNGIFMVLGISTILMVFVMGCVGYEKLIHQKKNIILDFICCRKSEKKKNRIHDGSISPEPLTRDHGRIDLPERLDEYVRAGPSRAFAF